MWPIIAGLFLAPLLGVCGGVLAHYLCNRVLYQEVRMLRTMVEELDGAVVRWNARASGLQMQNKKKADAALIDDAQQILLQKNNRMMAGEQPLPNGAPWEFWEKK
jgi:hypothetical protein